jgi:hypothetical protein
MKETNAVFLSATRVGVQLIGVETHKRTEYVNINGVQVYILHSSASLHIKTRVFQEKFLSKNLQKRDPLRD